MSGSAGPKQAPPQMRPMAKSQRNLDTICSSVTGVRKLHSPPALLKNAVLCPTIRVVIS